MIFVIFHVFGVVENGGVLVDRIIVAMRNAKCRGWRDREIVI